MRLLSLTLLLVVDCSPPRDGATNAGCTRDDICDPLPRRTSLDFDERSTFNQGADSLVSLLMVFWRARQPATPSAYGVEVLDGSFALLDGTNRVQGTLFSSYSNTTTYDLTVTGNSDYWTIGGTASAVRWGETANLTFNHLGLSLYPMPSLGCFPGDGSLQMVRAAIEETLLLNGLGRASGEESLSVTGQNLSVRVTLPGYGDCGTVPDAG